MGAWKFCLPIEESSQYESLFRFGPRITSIPGDTVDVVFILHHRYQTDGDVRPEHVGDETSEKQANANVEACRYRGWKNQLSE